LAKNKRRRIIPCLREAGLNAIEKMRAIVELAKHGNPIVNSITGMLVEVFYNMIVDNARRNIVGIVMLTIGKPLGHQTTNGLVGR